MTYSIRSNVKHSNPLVVMIMMQRTRIQYGLCHDPQLCLYLEALPIPYGHSGS